MKKNISISVAIGVLGGALLGQLDGSLIILDELNRSFSFIYILAFLVFSVCIYSLFCSVMMTMFCFAGSYAQNKIKKLLTDNQILGIYSGAFTLAAIFFFVLFNQSGLVSGFFKQRIIGSLIVIFSAGLFIAASTGMGISYFNEKYHSKNLLQGMSLFLSVGIVLLADGLWLVFLNMYLLKTSPFTLRIVVNLFSVATFLAVLKVLFNSFARLRHMKKIPVIKIIALVTLNCILFTAVEWGIMTFVSNDKSAQVKTAMLPYAHNNSAMKGMRPNVLWIVMDTVRADHLSCYGYKHVTSPAIDKIAEEGLIFEKAFSTAPWTLPSHASMFTGMYPRTHQTTNSHQYLSNRFTTIAEILRSNGYMTAGFSNNPYVSPLTNLNQGFDVFFDGFVKANYEDCDQRQGWRSACQTNKEISLWLKKMWDPKIPFFVFINYMEAHLPYWAPESYVRPFLPANISDETARRVRPNIPNTFKHYAGLVKLDKTDFDILRALYDGQIRYLDHYLKELFDQLRALEILDRTIVIITSDHGENLGENNKLGHVFSVDDRLLRVPLIIRYPQIVPAKERVARVVQTTQIFPTILDIIGLEWEGLNTIQGESLLQQPPSIGAPLSFLTHLIYHPTESPSSLGIAELDTYYDGIREIIHLNRNCFVDKYARCYKTIRDQNYKYIIASDGLEEIYDLDNDPYETNNLINRYPDKGRKLHLKLNEAFNSFPVPALNLIETEKAPEMDQQTLQKFRDLGYVQ